MCDFDMWVCLFMKLVLIIMKQIGLKKNIQFRCVMHMDPMVCVCSKREDKELLHTLRITLLCS